MTCGFRTGAPLCELVAVDLLLGDGDFTMERAGWPPKTGQRPKRARKPNDFPSGRALSSARETNALNERKWSGPQRQETL